MEHWFGIPKPWHAFIGHTFGEYILIDYHNLPNDDPSNKPPVYRFMLEYCGTKIVAEGGNFLTDDSANATSSGMFSGVKDGEGVGKLSFFEDREDDFANATLVTKSAISYKKHQICYIDACDILQLEKRI